MNNYDSEFCLDMVRRWDPYGVTIVKDELDGTFQFVTGCSTYQVELFCLDGQLVGAEVMHVEDEDAGEDAYLVTTCYGTEDFSEAEDAGEHFLEAFVVPQSERDLTPDGAQLLVERYRRTEEEYVSWRNELYASWLARHGLDIATVDDVAEMAAVHSTTPIQQHLWTKIQVHMMDA
jgi:hypothetical protein